MPTGSVYNGLPGNNNVTSGNLWLFARDNIGASGNRIETAVGRIEGRSHTGSTYINNNGSIKIGDVLAGLPNPNTLPSGSNGPAGGISSGGAVYFDAVGSITLSENITAILEIVAVSVDTAGDDEIRVLGCDDTGCRTISSHTSIDLNSGDGITIEPGATLTTLGPSAWARPDHAGRRLRRRGGLPGRPRRLHRLLRR